MQLFIGGFIMANAKRLELTAEDKKHLELITRSRTTQAQIVQRAKILLLNASGLSIDEIAEKLDINRNSVMLCHNKYKECGIENALTDAHGRGCKPEITDEEKALIISIAFQTPYHLGYAAETWTQAKLTKHINDHAESAGYIRLSSISQSSIQRALERPDIKPHKILL